MIQTQSIEYQEQERVLTMAVIRASDKLGLSGKDLAMIIGVSEATVSRMRNDTFWLKKGTKEFELGAHFVRFFRSLDALTGGNKQVAYAWLRNDNRVFGGPPLDQIKTISGMIHGFAYLDSRRAPL